MGLTRRQFLQRGAVAAAAITAPHPILRAMFGAASAEAAPPSDAVIVVIQLEGGNDGLNTLIPIDNAGSVAQRTLYDTARPTLGVLRLSTGDVVPLDRSVIMGRNPKADGANEAERPHVVRLPSPGHDISRTHVEIRLDGWHVLLTDLNSVNGTIVTPPWQEPQRLRPNESVPIEPGTVVSLADEVTFRYEVTG